MTTFAEEQGTTLFDEQMTTPSLGDASVGTGAFTDMGSLYSSNGNIHSEYGVNGLFEEIRNDAGIEHIVDSNASHHTNFLCSFTTEVTLNQDCLVKSLQTVAIRTVGGNLATLTNHFEITNLAGTVTYASVDNFWTVSTFSTVNLAAGDYRIKHLIVGTTSNPVSFNGEIAPVTQTRTRFSAVPEPLTCITLVAGAVALVRKRAKHRYVEIINRFIGCTYDVWYS